MDDKVIVIDENEEELTQEEIEERERNERLKKLKRKPRYNSNTILIILKCLMLLGILGVMLGMFTENATVLIGSLALSGVSAVVSYFFFR